MIDFDEHWFYDSITRYKNLHMFEMEYPVHKMESAADNSICVFCSQDEKHQFLELSLPSKLTTQLNNRSDTTITSDTDLKIRCGTFTTLGVSCMKTIQKDRKLIASHFDLEGVTVYKLSCDDSDEITQDSLIDSKLKGAELSLSGEELVLSKWNTLPTYLLDTITGQTTNTIPALLTESVVENMIPLHVDNKLLALCNEFTGQLTLFDTRDCKPVKCVNAENPGCSNLWAFTSLYTTQKECGAAAACLALVSNEGTFNVIDARKWDVPCVRGSLKHRTDSVSIQINLTPQKMSVSGFDGNVYVYNLTTEPELVFTHDGHRHVEGFTGRAQTLSHLWFPGIENLVISSAANATVHAWQFEDKPK